MTSLESTLSALRANFARDTSELPDRWTAERPSTGHCSVASLIIQQRHGGEILTGLVVHTGGRDWHQWNLVSGAWIDATADQFRDPWASKVGIWEPEPGHLRYVTGLANTLADRMAAWCCQDCDDLLHDVRLMP